MGTRANTAALNFVKFNAVSQDRNAFAIDGGKNFRILGACGSSTLYGRGLGCVMFFRKKPADAAKGGSAPDKSKNVAAPTKGKTDNTGASLKSIQPTQATSSARAKTGSDAAKGRQVAEIMTSLGGIVSVLMRTKQFRTLTVADLEALVVPPLLCNQFAIASTHSNANGLVSPAAIALWAQVSAEVDQRLSTNLDEPFRLAPNEWRSGDIPWLMATAGDPRGVNVILKQLQENRLKGKSFKIRGKRQDGKEVVGNLASKAAKVSQKPPK